MSINLLVNGLNVFGTFGCAFMLTFLFPGVFRTDNTRFFSFQKSRFNSPWR